MQNKKFQRHIECGTVLLNPGSIQAFEIQSCKTGVSKFFGNSCFCEPKIKSSLIGLLFVYEKFISVYIIMHTDDRGYLFYIVHCRKLFDGSHKQLFLYVVDNKYNFR